MMLERYAAWRARPLAENRPEPAARRCRSRGAARACRSRGRLSLDRPTPSPSSPTTASRWRAGERPRTPTRSPPRRRRSATRWRSRRWRRGLVHKTELGAVRARRRGRGRAARPRRGDGLAPRSGQAAQRGFSGPGNGGRRPRDHLRHLDRPAVRAAPHVRPWRQIRRGVPRRAFRGHPAHAQRGARHGARRSGASSSSPACAASRRPTSRSWSTCCCGSRLLAERHPRIAELDLNPFLAAPVGRPSLAVDARLRVRRPAS